MLNSFLKFILPKRTFERHCRSQAKKAGQKYYEQIDVSRWTQCLNSPRLDPVLKKMFIEYEQSDSAKLTSNYWLVLNKKNVMQLMENGYDNFKQTVALNYFTFLFDKTNLQVNFLEKVLNEEQIQWAKSFSQDSSKKHNKHALFTEKQSAFHNYMTCLLWEYAKGQVSSNLLDQLSEPSLGNPPSIMIDKRGISQDLLNAALEHDSITQGVNEIFGKEKAGWSHVQTIMEIGAGYGRTAYVHLTLHKHLKYIIVDVPPALYISQKYLSQCFPDKKIFSYRPFRDFFQIEEEYKNSQIIFLMPHQIAEIPDHSIDLFLAVDCLHEMRPGEIQHYFERINRLARTFYLTCNTKTSVPYENIELTEKDFAPLPHWNKVFYKQRRVQHNYFEAFYGIEKTGISSLI
ncbi:MAG: putative sugar O-methyltransferase [Candidatus Omnitrophica bacterium]|nr:putative sugar O-methyltransferase [Candidatus Omnitrophota bacterium]